MQEPEQLPEPLKFTLCEVWTDEVLHARGYEEATVRRYVAERLRAECGPGNVLMEGRTWIERSEKKGLSYVWAEAYGYKKEDA